MNDYYDEDGNWHGDDDDEAEGYECGKCGYVPTYRELHAGVCPGCAEERRRKREQERETERRRANDKLAEER